MKIIENGECGLWNTNQKEFLEAPRPFGGIHLHVGDGRSGLGPGHEVTSEFLFNSSLLFHVHGVIR